MPFAFTALARLSQLPVWFIKLDIYPELIETGQPQQNGVHERMHRLHEALGMKRPVEVYQPSERGIPTRIKSNEYPAHYLVRRVSRCGTIRVLHNQVFVSQTLNEGHVGLEEVDDGIYDLFFCFYQIGRYDLRANKMHDFLSKAAVSRTLADLPTKV